jgi:deoxyadenosine/deoxycytidine kinase
MKRAAKLTPELTTRQVVKHIKSKHGLDVSNRWVRLQCDTGRLSYRIKGRNRMFRVDHIDQRITHWQEVARGVSPSL